MQSPTNATREQVSAAVLSSARVQAAIEKTTSEGRDDAKISAKAIFDGMYADVQQPTVRTSLYIMRKVRHP